MKHSNLFVDEALLEVRSGSGGDGTVAFRREKFVARGGPNGGDGGRGGDVVLVADTNVATLLDFKSARRIAAESGERGGNWNKKGASGADAEVRVPVGTLVYEIDSDERSDLPTAPISDETSDHATGEGQSGGTSDHVTRGGQSGGTSDHVTRGGQSGGTSDHVTGGGQSAEPLADLTRPGQRIVIARGGKGGLGNARFKTSTRQAPDFATPGQPGQIRHLRLCLKLMADVGLIGFPNAGKSTLLRRISAARPRVANYPFTTLVPSLGVVERDERRCVVADIPGLIEGAADGAGLGHQFLRHVERTRVLIHVLDLEAMLVEGRDLIKDYDAIRRELERYRPELLERREILVLNKCDLLHDESSVAPLVSALAARGLECLRVSGAASQGIEALVRDTFDAVDAARLEDEEKES